MDRKEFLKTFFKLSVATGAAIVTGNFDKLLGAEKPPVKGAAGTGKPALVAVKGSTPEKMFDAGIKVFGGMEKFVKPGQTVVVKPNIGWDVAPEGAANTNPALVAAIVKHCLDAGAKEVVVFDHSCDSWEDTYRTSGIQAAAKKAGAKVAPANKREHYQKVSVPGGTILKSAEAHKAILAADVFINVPVLKSHGTTKVTIGMKNLMGIVWNRGFWHSSGIHECIADFAAYRKPDLTVVDCWRVMTRNGPRGVSAEDVVEMGSQVLSTDMVAADAAAAKIYGVEPADIRYIALAHERGLGNMNLEEVNIEKIYL